MKNKFNTALARRAKEFGFDSYEDLRKHANQQAKLRRDYKRSQGFNA